MRVAWPVAFGWFVESSPRVSASAKQRPPAASTSAPASTVAGPSFVSKEAAQPLSVGGMERSACAGCRAPPHAARAARGPPPPGGGPAPTVGACELPATFLEPVDRRRCLGRKDL